jgi:hypothetical protein
MNLLKFKSLPTMVHSNVGQCFFLRKRIGPNFETLIFFGGSPNVGVNIILQKNLNLMNLIN